MAELSLLRRKLQRNWCHSHCHSYGIIDMGTLESCDSHMTITWCSPEEAGVGEQVGANLVVQWNSSGNVLLVRSVMVVVVGDEHLNVIGCAPRLGPLREGRGGEGGRGREGGREGGGREGGRINLKTCTYYWEMQKEGRKKQARSDKQQSYMYI